MRKKKDEYNNGMKTIKKEFVKQYTEFLKPYGFKKIKGNQPFI